MRPGRMVIRRARKRGFRSSRISLASPLSRSSTARMKPKRSARFFMIRWKIAAARNDCAIFEKNLAIMSPESLMVAPIPMRRQSRHGWNESELTSSTSKTPILRHGWYQRPIVTAFRQHRDHTDLVDELDRVVSEIEKFVRER